jgi:hypothetical protein
MQAGASPARQARVHHRHDLRTLTYVTLEEANGGIVRNLSAQGLAVQAVAALRPQQCIRVRFELGRPRLRIETRGEVIWSNPKGQCGLRFLDLPTWRAQQINAWIFENLLESAPRFPWAGESSVEAASSESKSVEIDDGLIVSPAPRKVIQLEPRSAAQPARAATKALPSLDPLPPTDWLSQPLSGRSLARTVDSLVVVAALLVFSLVFLSVTHELPKWPVAMVVGAAVFVSAFYWGFFRIFAGTSLGGRLAKIAAASGENGDGEGASGDRFR